MRGETDKPRRGAPDFQLLILTLLLVGFGIVMVFSSSSSITLIDAKFGNDPMYFTKRQIIFACLGLVFMFVTMNIRYDKYKKLFVPVFILAIMMLVLVPIIGDKRNGATSWFAIGTLGIQPTELAKITTILYLAALISKKGERFRDLRTGYIPVMVIVGFVAGLIMLQPDFGSCMILVATSGLIIFAGGANLKHILGSIGLLVLGASIVLAAGALWDKIHPSESATDQVNYKVGRIQAYLDPMKDPLGNGYNLLQSLTAIGHGGPTGTGFGQGIQKLHYLPNAYNDFIFSVIGEEFGFIGTLLFLLFYVYFIWRGLLISLRCQSTFGTLTGVGIMGLIAIQAFINIGGVTNTIPMTGVTLPFISYGGSSLLAMMMSMGILLSISRESTLPAKQERTKSVVVRESAVYDFRSRRQI
ncbi:MAG: putative lipid II flippase FtsW [Paenibacillus macerans]|uniref:Probable peptidoglycan glycosyltransferase FtsW n=1 Tax=Paenibacillus macerans TaxID=44252 RepID=A0A6N8EWA1_PAEMA|nr:putative lipid II flippase FtsW [Paenibacillus macerans]MBS5911681.1 putative lipid II flippase FtsW [Paenibacillus macerans]MDU7474522.1 putative lipid II flippase FtsW [Paenibacillus macerans]MEC0140077.1 putative lipid II flippase FtsW [Paenibacillus macerans]MUG22568.1 putative lipid II flippase FtsW [Paenibacillus macerans]GBK64212.1 putative lipid II flippase FtsW [Paenibacillus macerans]